MFLVLFLLLPIVELYVFVQVAGAIGFGSALLAAVGATVVGVWLVKQQGLGVLRRANDKVARGEAPTDEIVNGTLLLLAGLLLLRSEEHTSELQSLMRISYAGFCLKKKINNNTILCRLLLAPDKTTVT